MMKRSIAIKIFSIALSLLLLMVVVAAVSIHSARGMRNEMREIADCYTPLTQHIARVNILTLEQGIFRERLLDLVEARSVERDAIDQQRGLYEEKSAAAGRETQEAVVILEACAAGTADPVEIARLQPMVATIAKEQKDLLDLSARILELLDQGESQAAAELRALLSKERDEFQTSVDGLRSRLQAFDLDSMREAEEREGRIVWLSIVITIGAAVSGLLFASLATGGLVRPIRRLLDGTKAIENGDLSLELPVTTGDEIGLLTQSFNHMIGQLRLKERIKDTFGKYIDPRIVERLLQADAGMAQAEKRVMTVFFSDIAGFTGISEGMTAQGIVNLINQYFAMMTQPVAQNGGIIDKFIGDAIMAFWGPPFVVAEDHARLACQTALEEFPKLEEYQRMMPELTGLRKGLPQVNIRIGIATGEVVVGNIGSEKTKSYTVMGDTVNLASRLEGVNKQYGTRLLVSEETFQMAGETFEMREIDSILVVGKSDPVRIYELLGRRGEVPAARLEMRQQYEEGLAAYRRRDWDQALAAFERSLQLQPEDAPSKIFLERVRHLRENPPAADWDGVWQLTRK